MSHVDPARRVAVFGGVYNNWLALEAVLADARAAGAGRVYCLGDVGAFGPYPDRSIELLRAADVPTVQGNYDHSVGHGLEDCQCGYSDPRDNHFAAISYDYTLRHTGEENRAWLRALPREIRTSLGTSRLLLCHGSPRRTNEFLWESTTPAPFIRRLLDEGEADVVVCTHTGLPWFRFLEGEARGLVNVGAIGRPDNDGDPAVHYALLTAAPAGPPAVEIRRVEYDHEHLAREMEREGILAEFVETTRTGWWTTCLEVLPAKERARSRF
ncbi:MAG: metallophosphoesterase family protein [Gemmatimonadetes bacterium]|nr:metallophosphoesterase family protein [Gemmatimonadota bacterium]